MKATYLGHSLAPLGKREREEHHIGRLAIFGAAVERKMKLRKGMYPK
jgi:hypothetical protein